MKTKIRKAEEKDYTEIVRVYQEAYGAQPYMEFWGEETTLRKIREEFCSMNLLVAEIDGKIEGFIVGDTFQWYDGKRGYIEDFGVSTNFRNKGLGTMLLEEMEKQLTTAGAKRIILDVKENVAAKEFYKNRGYQPTGYVQMGKKI